MNPEIRREAWNKKKAKHGFDSNLSDGIPRAYYWPDEPPVYDERKMDAIALPTASISSLPTRLPRVVNYKPRADLPDGQRMILHFFQMYRLNAPPWTSYCIVFKLTGIPYRIGTMVISTKVGMQS